jgi:hypothetical protein
MTVDHWQHSQISALVPIAVGTTSIPDHVQSVILTLFRHTEEKTHIIVCSAQLPDCECSDTRIDSARTEELQGVIGVDFRPMRQKLLHGLFHLRGVSPRHRLEEFGQSAFITSQVESEFPDEILLFRCQGLAGCIVKYLLKEEKSQNLRKGVGVDDTYPKLIPEFGIGFQFPIPRATAVAANETAMLVLNWVFACNVGIYDRPKLIFGGKGR